MGGGLSILQKVRAHAPASTTGSDPGMILTALILSGGSSGVNSLMVALGYRERGRGEDVVPKAPENQAWIAARAVGVKAVGPGLSLRAGGHRRFRGDLVTVVTAPGARDA